MFLTLVWLRPLECQSISGHAIGVSLPFSFFLFIPHTTSPEISLFAAFQAAVSWLQAIWLAALQKKKCGRQEELLQITIQLLFITLALASIYPTALLKG